MGFWRKSNCVYKVSYRPSCEEKLFNVFCLGWKESNILITPKFPGSLECTGGIYPLATLGNRVGSSFLWSTRASILMVKQWHILIHIFFLHPSFVLSIYVGIFKGIKGDWVSNSYSTCFGVWQSQSLISIRSRDCSWHVMHGPHMYFIIRPSIFADASPVFRLLPIFSLLNWM